MTVTFEGQVRTWTLDPAGSKSRKYITVETEYGVARSVFKADVFNPKNNRGEQRAQIPAHIRKLRREMEGHTFTPTPVTAGLRQRHRDALSYSGDNVVVVVVDGDVLPLTDGQQRFAAIAQIREAAEKAEDPEFVRLVDSLPVTVTLLLDGNTQTDFLNLQRGKAVDTSHLMSLSVISKTLPGATADAVRLAYTVARMLNADNESPFKWQIRFTYGAFPLPIKSLCATGASDVVTSLVGLAKVGLAADRKVGAEELVGYVCRVVNALREDAPGLTELQKALTPPPDATRGSANMLIGLATCLAYRATSVPQESWGDGERDLAKLVKAAKATLDVDVTGDFSGPTKRRLMGEFAAEFFADLNVPKYEGVPEALLEILSVSGFGLSPKPKQKRQEAA